VKHRALGAVLALLVVLSIVACSPEAARTRGGGPGADVGNHSRQLPEPSTPPLPAARP